MKKIKRLLEYYLRNQVYTARAGLTKGLKRREGLGFIPKSSLTKEHSFLKSLDFRDKNVYDIGGYQGLITLFFARAVGNKGSVTTFEPNPNNHCLIMDHIQLNQFKNIRIIPVGLGKQQEKLKFVVNDQFAARGTAHPGIQNKILQQKGAKVMQIEVDTLDHQFVTQNLPPPHFIKIDIEGLELDVLSGMSTILTHYKPQLFTELHSHNQAEIVNLLFSYGYKIYQVENDIDITPQNTEKAVRHLYVS